ncbi:polycystin family receptor for egg jelly-like isoform X2 [Argopecten irradians]|uniref:polycystin family receptor for egg jelly-like isoform X2 n=1 Tax=Argopecten irradians TaxID=31199 RepID=UPI00371F90C2
MIPPDMIDFQSVFLNFSERLSDTPYVLGTVIAVLVLFVIITPVLYRRDNIDNTLWSYQHLPGNNDTSAFRYYICISTGLRSKRRMESTVYINITGTRGETGTRMLTGRNRKNFSNGTSSYFYLTTDVCIGNITAVQIWLGEDAKLSSWYLTRVVLIDGITKNATRLKCNRWLSMEKGTGQTWCTLKVGQNSDSTVDISEVSARNILDDNLWFSLLFRPQYNRFTRVQRLWCVGSLLFLSMVASAMFYDTPDDTTPFVKTAYFEIGYKELYTGFISSAVTVVPSLIMTYIFSKRNLRGEKFQQNNSDALRPFGKLPWWSIFLAYTVCLVCIASGSFFTFLYSLEWGPSLTIQWMSAFFIGTTESVILIEPTKALVLAVLIVCLCSEKTGENDFHFPPISVYPKIKDIYNQGNQHDMLSPCDKPETTDQLRRRYIIRMDRKLNTFLRNFAMGLAYICVLMVIGSQQKVSEVSRQNLQIKSTLTATGEIKSIEDVWMYIEAVVLHRLYSSEFYNGEIKSFDDLRFIEDNLKMGPLRIRQIRVSDTCAAPALLRTYAIHCLPGYDTDNEDKGVYTKGWIPWNTSDLWDGVDTPYRYHYTSPEETPTYWGLFGTYGASGYLVDLDILPDEAINVVRDLKNDGWLDQKTRALFIEICLMNRNNRLFTQVKIVFELPSTGRVFMNTQVVSANLYPYTNTFDFIVLALQLIFVVTIFIRLVSLIVKVIKTRGHSLTTTSQVLDILHLGVSIAAVVYFFMRFTDTISVLNTLRQDTGFYTSFGWVFLWDEYYTTTLGIITFIAILDVLKNLSFNYYLFLMYKTILSFRSEVFHFLITLSIIIVGFASLIHLIYGHSESGFSSMATSILTLFRMTIGIIKFRHDIQVVVVGIFIIIGLYASMATILFVNLFVSSLDHRLSYIKECIRKGLTSFDSHLSSHFWNRLSKVFTICGSTQREQEHECDTDRPKGDVTCDRFLSTILKRFEDDSILERSALESVLLHLERRCRLRTTLNGLQFRYSIDWSKEDNTLIMEFFRGTVYCNITVDTYTIPEACRRGLVPYGESTQPISIVFKIHQLKGRQRHVSGQNSVTMDTKQKFCHVMIKVPSDILSCRPTFLIIRSRNHNEWYQLPAKRDPAKEGEVYLSASTSCFPHYVLAVISDLWPGIPPTVQEKSAIEYTLTKSGDVFYLPGMCKKIAVVFPEACVSQDTEITILLERGDNFPVLHFLAHGDISGPIAVQFRRKRNIPTCGDESQFKLMTKQGDLEWKEGNPGARTFQTDLSVQIDCLKESVRTSITVCKSGYLTLFHKKTYLDHQKGILLCIYNKTITTQHWRKIGRNLGFSQKWLTELEVRKPRTLEEKACVILQQWLRGNGGRNLFDIRERWM